MNDVQKGSVPNMDDTHLYDEEYAKILSSHPPTVNIDGGTMLQVDLLATKPTKPSIKSKIITALKRRGVDVTFIDPKTFKEYK